MLSGVGEGMESEDSNAGKKGLLLVININKNYPVEENRLARLGKARQGKAQGTHNIWRRTRTGLQTQWD